MSEYQEIPIKFLSISSSENRGSIDSSNAEADRGDEEFYEKIEAPKFVDFTLPDHYRPDDRFWFCDRVGCDQKHEQEMDSEEIYKKFVLRVMAARSPNVKLRRALDRNACRTPIKCPHSAPPKSSKPRLTRMAIISSFSKKMADEKKRAVKPLSRSGSTPLVKTKPVAAKYLTTPRNKRSIPSQNAFRSVQNPKPVDVDVGKGRLVAKALVFHSPKKAIKVKTSVELRTPISKLCEGMNKLEISSQKKRVLGYSSKSPKNVRSSLSRRRLSSRKVQRKPEEPKSCKSKDAKSGKSVKSKVKGELLLKQASKNNESRDVKQLSSKNVVEQIGIQDCSHEEECGSAPNVLLPTHESAHDNLESNNSRSKAAEKEENNSNYRNDNIDLQSSGEAKDNLNATEGERIEDEFMDSDDKENASASDGNRINTNPKENGRKIFGLHDKSGQVQKKVTQQSRNKILNETASGTVMKLKKPKATNPKPFRLRTDERGILREAILEKRTDSLTSQSDTASLSTPVGKLQRKQVNDIQKRSMIIGVKTQKGPERSKAAVSVTAESNRKPITSPLRSNAMQRLEKFRKITSPLPKLPVRPQGVVSTKQETIPFLTPGQKLDVIPEASPEVASDPRRAEKPTGRRPVVVAMEPNFHSSHVPRSCTKKLK